MTYYLIDNIVSTDEQTYDSEGGHLLAFNPGPRDSELTVTVYYTDADPEVRHFRAPARGVFETNCRRWEGLRQDVRFALAVESPEPLACQVTAGWNNAKSNFAPDAPTRDPQGVRECARSYMALPRLAREWCYADGIILDNPSRLWVKESEYCLILNPGAQAAEVTLALHYADGVEERAVRVGPRRLECVFMDPLARKNVHYGVLCTADLPVAAQWIREVRWYHRPDPMTFWSVPFVPGPLA